VLANMLDLGGFNFSSTQEVLESIPDLIIADTIQVSSSRLSNNTTASVDLVVSGKQPCVASIYQLDGIVRRSSALQATADAKSVETLEVAA
jgi:NADH-quinone oxidoreductase subunit G